MQPADAERKRDFAILAEIRRAFGAVPDDELEREVNRAFEAARAQARAGGRSGNEQP